MTVLYEVILPEHPHEVVTRALTHLTSPHGVKPGRKYWTDFNYLYGYVTWKREKILWRLRVASVSSPEPKIDTFSIPDTSEFDLLEILREAVDGGGFDG